MILSHAEYLAAVHQADELLDTILMTDNENELQQYGAQLKKLQEELKTYEHRQQSID
jgi:hypothetical protein